MEVPPDPTPRAFEEGRARYPEVALHAEAFARGLEVRGAVESGAVAAHAVDLFLSIACDEGVAGAWDAFEKEYAPRLRGLLRKRGASEQESSEFLAELPGYLCEPPPGGSSRTRIGTFDGSSSLFTWLGVVVLRNVQHRRRRRSQDPVPIEAAAEPDRRRDSPSSAAVAEETAQRFEVAISAAWETLTSRERLAVLLRYRDGLRGSDVARLLEVGEPRVSRLLRSGLDRLRDAVRAHMPDTPPGTSTPDQAAWQALHQVLVRHLATLESPPHQPGEVSDG